MSFGTEHYTPIHLAERAGAGADAAAVAINLSTSWGLAHTIWSHITAKKALIESRLPQMTANKSGFLFIVRFEISQQWFGMGDQSVTCQCILDRGETANPIAVIAQFQRNPGLFPLKRGCAEDFGYFWVVPVANLGASWDLISSRGKVTMTAGASCGNLVPLGFQAGTGLTSPIGGPGCPW